MKNKLDTISMKWERPEAERETREVSAKNEAQIQSIIAIYVHQKV